LRRLAALLAAAGFLSCSEPPAPGPTRTWRFHALAGVSMGAIGTSLLAGWEDKARRVDVVGMLGGPFDSAFMLHAIEASQMGGFCPYARLVQAAAADAAGGTPTLDDPDSLTDCAGPVKPWVQYQLEEDFNHWAFTANGGHFNRNSYLDIFYDLSLALGNPLFHNPDVPAFAPGITRQNLNSDLCATPVVFDPSKGRRFYNAEYNPEGKYPVISFCDGQPPPLYCGGATKTPVDYCAGKTPEEFCAGIDGPGTPVLEASEKRDDPWVVDYYYSREGVYDPCWRGREPASFGLAVDFNGNGRRDYHEPVISNAHERFRDTGVDGCPDDREDGKGGCTASGAAGDPNGDDFDTVRNPSGTEDNWTWEPGEPYDDFGLDGVADTHDFGEGDGRCTQSAAREKIFGMDFRRRYLAMTPQERRELDVYADGGIRDVFNFGIGADQMFGAVKLREPAASTRFASFFELPPGEWGASFNPLKADYSRLGRNTFVRYGKTDPTPQEIRDGDGGHVGTVAQAVQRFIVFFKWLSQRWGTVLGGVDVVAGMSRHERVVFDSQALASKWNFEIALPASYDLEPERRFPVLYMGHGYGMDEDNMAAVNMALDTLVLNGDVIEMIVVYPNGRCCFRTPEGAKDCRRYDDDGSDLRDKPGYVRECASGGFYVNHTGSGAGDDTRYGDAMFELMDYVDAHYRVLAPVTVPWKEAP